jgi:hypothetical protein
MEMPPRGKRGKPNCGFPLFPPRLEIAERRDSHIPTGAAACCISSAKNAINALRALAGAETACPTYLGQVITTVVPSAALLAGFGVTAIGRI